MRQESTPRRLANSHRRDAGAAASYAVLAVAIVLPSLVTWLYFVVLADRSAVAQQGTAAVGKLLQFSLPLLWVFFIQRHKLQLTLPRASDCMVGLASGIAIAAAMLVLYFRLLKPSNALAAAIVEVQQKVAGLGIDAWWKFAALGIFYALVHSLLEEYYWRWFVFGELRRLMSFWPAASVSSLGFMAHHVILLGVYFGFDAPMTYFFAICVAIGGMIWAWLYDRTGSLYGPWLSHLAVDAGIFFIGWDMVKEMLA
jgi:membrane protease YdiL (CAAX protease family)